MTDRVYLIHPDDHWFDELMAPASMYGAGDLMTGEVGRIDGIRIIKYKWTTPTEPAGRPVGAAAQQSYLKFGNHCKGGRR